MSTCVLPIPDTSQVTQLMETPAIAEPATGSKLDAGAKAALLHGVAVKVVPSRPVSASGDGSSGSRSGERDCRKFRVLATTALKFKRRTEHGGTHTRSETVPR